MLLQPMPQNPRVIILGEGRKDVLRQVKPNFDLKCEKAMRKVMHKT